MLSDGVGRAIDGQQRTNSFLKSIWRFAPKLYRNSEASPELPLAIDVAPVLKGVYARFWKNKLVYAGKALHTTLKRRLNEHTAKITSRKNISIVDMTCRFTHHPKRLVCSSCGRCVDRRLQPSLEQSRIRKPRSRIQEAVVQE